MLCQTCSAPATWEEVTPIINRTIKRDGSVTRRPGTHSVYYCDAHGSALSGS